MFSIVIIGSDTRYVFCPYIIRHILLFFSSDFCLSFVQANKKYRIAIVIWSMIFDACNLFTKWNWWKLKQIWNGQKTAIFAGIRNIPNKKFIIFHADSEVIFWIDICLFVLIIELVKFQRKKIMMDASNSNNEFNPERRTVHPNQIIIKAFSIWFHENGTNCRIESWLETHNVFARNVIIDTRLRQITQAICFLA